MALESGQTLADIFTIREKAYEILVKEKPGNKFDAATAFAESALWVKENIPNLNVYSLQANVRSIRQQTQEIMQARGASTRIRHYITPVADGFSLSLS